MRWLRSRWTVVALVPTFFLVGFGIVSSFAGSDELESSAQQPTGDSESVPDATTAPTTVAGTAPTDATTAQEDATSTAEGTATAPASERDDDGGNGGNGGGPPPAPPAGSIDFDYGRWDGVFEVDNPEITPDFGFAAVTGEFRYLGGIDCQVGLIVAKVWFYDGRGRRIGDGIWESSYATGAGGEVTGREPLPFEAYGPVSELPESAFVRFTKADCL
jgi:hypothetical protein